MLSQSSTILAVDPGTRELGVAVLRAGELLYYRVKTIKNRKNPALVLELVTSYIRNLLKKYRPAHVAVEKMFVTQKNSALLVVVANQIKFAAEQAGLPVSEYAPVTVRKRLCKTGRATKREVARLLAERFPELKGYFLRTTAGEQDYYSNIFDAVAVGVVCAEDLQEIKMNADEAMMTET